MFATSVWGGMKHLNYNLPGLEQEWVVGLERCSRY